MKLVSKQVVIAVLFGVCVGFAGARWGFPRIMRHRWSSGQFQHRLLDRFSSTLKLTLDQRAQVAAIMEAKRQKMDALRAEIRPQFQALRTSTSAEIRQVLTPEQQKTFDAMQEKQQARMKRFHDRWGGFEDGR